MSTSIKIITEKTAWKSAVESHGITDVYFQYEYVAPMATHFDAEPILIDYCDDNGGFVYALLVMDIAKDKKFKGLLPEKTWFDAETPYGYGGPCFYGMMKLDNDSVFRCKNLINEALVSKGIITQFIRFYPLMFEDKKSTLIVDEFDTYKSTVYMELTNEAIIMSNLDSKYRWEIKKAQKYGVHILHDKGENVQDFIRLYEATMDMHKAEKIYYFNKGYYRSMLDNFKNNIEIFYAFIDNNIVGAAIFMYDKQFMHYHLAGRDIYAPNIGFEKLLLVEAAKWGSGQGIKKLHVGGGVTEGDSLFQYKKKFNRSGILPFYIGRTIVDEAKYNELINLRKNNDPNFDPNNKFYIQYRF